MNILYVYAHPNPKSFNAALKDQALTQLQKSGFGVVTSDLYAMHFKPQADWDDFKSQTDVDEQYMLVQKQAAISGTLRADIQAEIDKVNQADAIILQFPLWWFGMPAILKGWFDRVFVKGLFYDAGKWFETSPLYPKKVALVTTTQSPSSSFQPNGLNGDIQTILSPIFHSLRFVGMQILPPFIAYAVANQTQEQRQSILADYATYLQSFVNLEPLEFPALNCYNAQLQLIED